MTPPERPTLSHWAFDMAKKYADRGTCARRLAGAVGLDGRNRVVAMGMNGVPSGFPHCRYGSPCPGADDPTGDTENCFAIHAEANMILNAVDSERIERVFITTSPCKACALLLCNLPNLKSVAYLEEYADRRGIVLLRRKVRIKSAFNSGNLSCNNESPNSN